MKKGAFVSVMGILALPLVFPASAHATGGPGTLASTLTATTTGQTLNLVTTVTSNGNGTFHWSFTLSNPSGNTVRIRSFTVAPFCDLTNASNIGQTPNPGGMWTFEKFAFSPQADPTLESNKINWFIGGVNAPLIDFLNGGNTITFFFDLPNGADPTFRGKAGALDTFGFSGDTLGCPPPPPPGGTGGTPPPGIPIRVHGPFYLAEAYMANVLNYAASDGISPDNCFLNGATQAPQPAAEAVPGVLCLDRHLTQILNNPFAICDANIGESNPRVQAVSLSKVIPGSFKCDAFGMPKVDATTGAISPAQTLFQDANHLRTWWTLRYTQPGTKFTLDVVVVCTGANGGPTFHIDRWVWIVVADVRTFPFVVDLLHQDAVGTFEIPCILAEDVASNIRSLFGNFATAIATGNPNGEFDGLINLEAFIAMNCVMTDVAMPEILFPGVPVNGQATYQPPGNQATVNATLGTGMPLGILDTTENPCCCKLLVDLEFMGQQLGISFGPHTFVNGVPV